MVIKTKADIGEQVCTMHNNKVCLCKVELITIVCFANKEIGRQYGIRVCETREQILRNEDQIFKTKQELLKTL